MEIRMLLLSALLGAMLGGLLTLDVANGALIAMNMGYYDSKTGVQVFAETCEKPVYKPTGQK